LHIELCEVINCGLNGRGVIPHVSKEMITMLTEETSDRPGCMVMVDSEMLSLLSISTDRAGPSLRFKYRFVLAISEAVFSS
jgi:hypothetical protein